MNTPKLTSRMLKEFAARLGAGGGGVEILPAEAAAASAGPVLLEDGRMYRVRWGELEVSQSAFACTYD